MGENRKLSNHIPQHNPARLCSPHCSPVSHRRSSTLQAVVMFEFPFLSLGLGERWTKLIANQKPSDAITQMLVISEASFKKGRLGLILHVSTCFNPFSLDWEAFRKHLNVDRRDWNSEMKSTKISPSSIDSNQTCLPCLVCGDTPFLVLGSPWGSSGQEIRTYLDSEPAVTFPLFGQLFFW